MEGAPSSSIPVGDASPPVKKESVDVDVKEEGEERLMNVKTGEDIEQDEDLGDNAEMQEETDDDDEEYEDEELPIDCDEYPGHNESEKLINLPRSSDQTADESGSDEPMFTDDPLKIEEDYAAFLKEEEENQDGNQSDDYDNFFDEDGYNDDESSFNPPSSSGGRHDHTIQHIYPDCEIASSCFLLERFKETSIDSFSTIDHIIQQLIERCIASGKDPRCCHEFYCTIHYLLTRAVEHHLISLEEKDSVFDFYWIKFDNLAKEAYQRLGEDFHMQRCLLANDPSQHPPLVDPPLRSKKGRGIPLYRINARLFYALEGSIHEFVMSFSPQSGPSQPSLREDIHCRVKFYQTWHAYSTNMYLPVMDYYWNLLLNRAPAYYDHNKPLADRHKSKKEKPIEIYRPVLPNWKQVLTKSLTFDRLMNNLVDSCIDRDIDPRCTHKFYWTIHCCLKAKRESMSELEAFPYWFRYDKHAANAYLTKQKLAIKIYQHQSNSKTEYYEDISEVPIPPSELSKITEMGRTELKKVLDDNIRDIVIKYADVEIRNDVKARKEFFYSYVNLVSPTIEESWIDRFWNKLCTQTVVNYKDYIEEKEKEKAQLERENSLKRKAEEETGVAVDGEKVIKTSSRGRVRKVKASFAHKPWKIKKPMTTTQKKTYYQKKQPNPKPTKPAAKPTQTRPTASKSQQPSLSALFRPYLQLPNEDWVLNLDNCSGPIVLSCEAYTNCQ